MEQQKLAESVLDKFLGQDDDELDLGVQSMVMRMRKNLDDDQREDCLNEMNAVVTKHIQIARSQRRFGAARQEYLENVGVAPQGPQGAAPVGYQERELQFHEL